MLIDELTTQFYAWERRGRGWQVWPVLVDLEPPYRPFLRSYTAPRKVQDDGRRPTLLSGAIEAFKGAFTTQPLGSTDEPTIEQYLDLVYPEEPPVSTFDTDIEEITFSLDVEAQVELKHVEQFILSLANLPHRVSFEVIGDGNTIWFQLACSPKDAISVRNYLRSFFAASIATPKKSLLNILKNAQEPVVVEFGLSEEFMRPIKVIDRIDPDPLRPLIATLEGLSDGEIGALQVLFQGTRYDWTESIMRSVSDGSGESFFVDAPEMFDLARKKVEHPLLSAVVRVLGVGESTERSWEIARGLGYSLMQLNEPMSNDLIPLENKVVSFVDQLQDFAYRQTCRSGMIVNSGELAGLVHPPSSLIRSDKLSRQTKTTRLAPKSMGESRYVLGQNEHAGIMRTVSLNDQQRLKHIHVIGSTGTGKSTLLKNLIAQDILNGNGIAVIDPHGDLIDDLLGLIPEERFENTILFDPASLDNKYGINILSAKTEFEKDVASSDLVALFRRFSSSWGDQMTSVLGNAIQAFLESDRTTTLADLRRFLLEKDFRDTFLESVVDEDIIYYWRHSFPLLKGNAQASIVTRLDSFLRPKLLRAVITQKAELDFGDAMSGRRILLAKLSQGLIGMENSTLLGSLLVSKLHQAALARQDQRVPFFLYIDEFQNFVTPSLASVLSGARKFGLGLVLAHQELRQISSQDAEVAESVISNPATRICFRLGDTDARKLRDGFAHFGVADLQSLNVGEAIGRIERSDNDFNLQVIKPQPVEDAVAAQRRTMIIDRSKRTIPPPVVPPQKHERTGQPIEPRVVRPIEKPADEAKPTTTHEVRAGSPPPVPPKPSAPVQTDSTSEPKENVQTHRYLQSLVKQLAESKGYRSDIEAPTGDGQGRVDVALSKAGVRIAVEISVSTSDVHELKNIKKCFADGCDKVLVCCVDKRRSQKIRSLAKEQLDESQQNQMVVCQPEDLVLFFQDEVTEESKAEEPSESKVVKWYRVKVKYQEPSDQEQKQRQVAQVVAKSIQRMQKRD
ncbi:MAG: type IV secretion system DNA-binding domain-containing protein [Ignavibacteriae bacterium]|nr:type IV secretion system DNA-binding domain-containing protein [Ignavibacteriota bacterium]